MDMIVQNSKKLRKHSYSHMDLPFEKNATERGEEYYKRWMRKPAND